jgi:hypothetical protein
VVLVSGDIGEKYDFSQNRLAASGEVAVGFGKASRSCCVPLGEGKVGARVKKGVVM